MTAKELIEKLSKFDMDKEIRINIVILDECYEMNCMNALEFESDITLFFDKDWIIDVF